MVSCHTPGALPPSYRPDPDNPDGPQISIRSDSAGATHAFVAACRKSGVGFSLGTAIDTRISAATEVLNTAAAWYPAVNPDDGIHDGAWVAEATDLSTSTAASVVRVPDLRRSSNTPNAQRDPAYSRRRTPHLPPPSRPPPSRPPPRLLSKSRAMNDPSTDKRTAPRGTDRLNHNVEESNNDPIHHVPGLDAGSAKL